MPEEERTAGSRYYLTDEEAKAKARVYKAYYAVNKYLIRRFGWDTAAYIGWLEDRFYNYGNRGFLQSDGSFWITNNQACTELDLSIESVRKAKKTCVESGVITILGLRRLTAEDSRNYAGTVKEFVRLHLDEIVKIQVKEVRKSEGEIGGDEGHEPARAEKHTVDPRATGNPSDTATDDRAEKHTVDPLEKYTDIEKDKTKGVVKQESKYTPFEIERPKSDDAHEGRAHSIRPQRTKFIVPNDRAETSPPKVTTKKTPRRRTRTPVSEDWHPDEKGRAFASERSVDVENEAPKFRDWHLAKGTLSADWSASWRTWCNHQAEWRKKEPERYTRSKPGVTASSAEGRRRMTVTEALMPCFPSETERAVIIKETMPQLRRVIDPTADRAEVAAAFCRLFQYVSAEHDKAFAKSASHKEYLNGSAWCCGALQVTCDFVTWLEQPWIRERSIRILDPQGNLFKRFCYSRAKDDYAHRHPLTGEYVQIAGEDG